MIRHAAAIAAPVLVLSTIAAAPAVAQAPRSSYNLTSMCKTDAVTGNLRVRNTSGVEQSYTLTKYGTTLSYSGTALGDVLVSVPWTKSSDTWVLKIDGHSFTKSIGNNALCA